MDRTDLLASMTLEDIQNMMTLALLFDRSLDLVWDRLQVGDILFNKVEHDEVIVVEECRGYGILQRTYEVSMLKEREQSYSGRLGMIYYNRLYIYDLIAGSPHLLND